MKRPSSLHVTASDLTELGRLLRATCSRAAWQRHPDRELYARVWHLLECLPGPEGRWRGHALMALSTRNPEDDARAPDEPEEQPWNHLLADELLRLIEKALVRRHLEWEEMNAEERTDLLLQQHALEAELDDARPIVALKKMHKQSRAKSADERNYERTADADARAATHLKRYDEMVAQGVNRREIVGRITGGDKAAEQRLRRALRRRARKN